MELTEQMTIAPREAWEKMQSGALLLDVRELPEWDESHVPGAALLPLGKVKSDPQGAALASEVFTLCKTGCRAEAAAAVLREQAGVAAKHVEGGIEAWRAAGLPTQKGDGRTISLERQVRIGAGVLILLGLLVRRLRFISYFVPCGLIFAGITDHCGMAKVLASAPWNQPRGDEQEVSCRLQEK